MHLRVLLFASAVAAAALPAAAQTGVPSWQWAKLSGHVSDFGGVATDAAGNVYVTGRFAGSAYVDTVQLTASSADYNLFLAKLHPNGRVQWVRQAGGLSGSTEGIDVAVDAAGSVYVTGLFEDRADFDQLSVVSVGMQDLFVAKYDAAGTVQWVNAAGGAAMAFPMLGAIDDMGVALAADPLGGVVVAGLMDDSTYFDTTLLQNARSFVARYSAAGTLQWAQPAAGWVEDVTVDPAGNAYLTGWFNDTARFQGTTLIASGLQEAYLVKYNPAGTVDWAKASQGNLVTSGRNVTADASGNVFLAGDFSGAPNFGNGTLTQMGRSNDVFVAKYSQAGQLAWVHNAGGTSSSEARGLTLDQQQQPYLTGYFSDTLSWDGQQLYSQGGVDMFVAKLDTLGMISWLQGGGSTDYDQGNSVAVDTAGNCLVYGSVEGPARFGSLSVGNGPNGFVAKFGNPQITAIPEPAGASLAVYPNPARDLVHLRLKGQAGAAGKVRLLNLQGQEVLRQSWKSEEQVTLAVAGLPAGLYLLELETPAGRQVQKLVLR